MTGLFATAHAKEVSGASDVFGGGRERCFKLVLHACLWPAGASSDSTASLGGGLGSRFRTNLCGMARHFSSRMFPALDLHHAPWRSDVAEPAVFRRCLDWLRLLWRSARAAEDVPFWSCGGKLATWDFAGGSSGSTASHLAGWDLRQLPVWSVDSGFVLNRDVVLVADERSCRRRFLNGLAHSERLGAWRVS